MPWWRVDLEEIKEVSSVNIYMQLRGKEFNKSIRVTDDNVFIGKIHGKPVLNKRPVLYNNFPLIIGISKDNRNWEYTSVYETSKAVPLHVKFETPQRLRYLKIIASGYCRLCLNEVEIFSPTSPKPLR